MSTSCIYIYKKNRIIFGQIEFVLINNNKVVCFFFSSQVWDISKYLRKEHRHWAADPVRRSEQQLHIRCQGLCEALQLLLVCFLFWLPALTNWRSWRLRLIWSRRWSKVRWIFVFLMANNPTCAGAGEARVEPVTRAECPSNRQVNAVKSLEMFSPELFFLRPVKMSARRRRSRLNH